jgi:porin
LPGDLFSDGVFIAVNATRSSALAGRRTTYGITGLYSTAEGADYSTIGGAVGTSTKSGSWNVNVQFTHNLGESQEVSDAAWGFYLKAGVADGNPNHVERSLVVGIGAYYYNLSDVLQDELNPIRTNFDYAQIYTDFSMRLVHSQASQSVGAVASPARMRLISP